MKIYSVQIVNGFYQHGSSILTASESEANRIRKFWQKDVDKQQTDKKLEVKIYKYEVKTQGKNFNDFALAHKYQKS